MVRVGVMEPTLLSDVVSGREFDGTALQKGDLVLLTQQANTSENGVWVVGGVAAEIKRPTSYMNAPGRQFFVTGGQKHRGTLYVCTSIGVTTEIKPIQSRPTLRDTMEERAYTKNLVQSDGGVRAARLGAPTTVDDDVANKGYIESLRIRATTLGPELEIPTERTQNTNYISGLGVQAASARRLCLDDATAVTSVTVRLPASCGNAWGRDQPSRRDSQCCLRAWCAGRGTDLFFVVLSKNWVAHVNGHRCAFAPPRPSTHWPPR
jgi:hypothetical protein